MNEPDLDEIAAELEDVQPGDLEFLAPGTAAPSDLVPRWRPVADAAGAAGRIEAALSLWNPEFRAAVPLFTRALTDHLTDVRVCRLRDEWALAYFAADAAGEQLAWIGWAPAGPDAARPVFWDTLPQPLQDFLTGVHDGFTAPDGESYGITRPAWMLTYAAWSGFEGPIPGWDGPGRIPATELMFLTRDSGLLHYCVSPHLPPGGVALVYEGDIDVRPDLTRELDQLMTERFDPR
jgi:hypothetical protein